MPNDASLFRFPPDGTFQTLLERNRTWAQRLSALRPTLFPTLGAGQSPQILWIGCSDSRVPATSILDLLPGEVFVHRNIANVLPPNDLSSLSVIQYAVEVLKVKIIIVCGHTACGGVNAALANNQLGLIDTWLKNIRDVRSAYLEELEAIQDPIERSNRLSELNVCASVDSLLKNSNVQHAISERGLEVHGVLLDVGTGLLREVKTDSKVPGSVYKLNK